MTIVFREELRDLKAYEPGKPIEDVKREYGLDQVIKLASNENPLGCSPKAKEAITKVLDQLNYYPDGNATDLKEAIAKKLNLKPSQVQPSSGSDEMLDSIAKTFLNKGDEVILADITFPRYMTTTKMMGATPIVVPLKDFAYDLGAMVQAITEKTRLIWLCNPNNPTGTMFTKQALLDFLKAVPKNIIIVYDEAYKEFVEDEDYPHDILDYLEEYPNLLVMRTFSKIYGLAALRVGYTLACQEILQNIDKIRGPFNVNTLAQAAALAALEDQDFLKKTYEVNRQGKEYIYKAFDEMGLCYAPSQTNHIFFDSGKDSRKIFQEMQKRGIIIRPMGGTYVRVSIGSMEQNQEFIRILKEVLA